MAGISSPLPSPILLSLKQADVPLLTPCTRRQGESSPLTWHLPLVCVILMPLSPPCPRVIFEGATGFPRKAGFIQMAFPGHTSQGLLGASGELALALVSPHCSSFSLTIIQPASFPSISFPSQLPRASHPTGLVTTL